MADFTLPPVDKQNLRRAAWAGGIGTALENFDFTIYGTASAIIFGKIFFPNLDPTVGTIAAFGTLFVGFGARPLGGLFFSKYGDRLGRKFVMVATLFLMGTATFAVGLIPSYATVGIWAPIMLLMVRFLQGFGAGAEQASGIVLLTETAPKGKRGRYASLVFVGAAAGAAMAAVVWILVQRMSDEALLSYGWRLVFFSSIFVTIAAWIIRRKVERVAGLHGAQGRGRDRAGEVAHRRRLEERQEAPRADLLHERRRQRALVHLPGLRRRVPHPRGPRRCDVDPEVPADRCPGRLRLGRRLRDHVRQVRPPAHVPAHDRVPVPVLCACFPAHDDRQSRAHRDRHRDRVHGRLAGHRRRPERYFPELFGPVTATRALLLGASSRRSSVADSPR